MIFFWGQTSAVSAKLDRLREAERVLIELAHQQNDSTNKTTAVMNDATNPMAPRIEPFDTTIPESCIHLADANSPCTTKKTLEQQCDESYKIHGISIISQNIHEKSKRCDKPLVLLHGYSK